MKKEVVKIERDPQRMYHAPGLNPDGSEIVWTEEIAVPLRQLGKTADQKLREMLHRELARAQEVDETNIDAYDFDLPVDELPFAPGVKFNEPSAAEIKERIREQKQESSKKAPDNGAAEDAKGPTASPKRPANGNKSKESASESSKPTVADDQDEE